MDKNRDIKNGVGIQVYQLKLVVVQQSAEEVPARDPKYVLNNANTTVSVLSLLANSCPAVAFQSSSALCPRRSRSTSAWMCSSVITDFIQYVDGSGAFPATISSVSTPWDLDLITARLLVCIRRRDGSGGGGEVRASRLETAASWPRVHGCGGDVLHGLRWQHHECG
uniref:Uncharacterized protein n=1 Tax=Setaria viridis TaxID=4556 RepID=A0A4U6T064_SETVI|nr:hypothetical protein SEVIR_9G283633v2 [Setaria viridis]